MSWILRTGAVGLSLVVVVAGSVLVLAMGHQEAPPPGPRPTAGAPPQLPATEVAPQWSPTALPGAPVTATVTATTAPTTASDHRTAAAEPLAATTAASSLMAGAVNAVSATAQPAAPTGVIAASEPPAAETPADAPRQTSALSAPAAIAQPELPADPPQPTRRNPQLAGGLWVIGGPVGRPLHPTPVPGPQGNG